MQQTLRASSHNIHWVQGRVEGREVVMGRFRLQGRMEERGEGRQEEERRVCVCVCTCPLVTY
jgi:hypothetical protein